MQAEVIAIGDELTSGQRLDTNSQWISQKLGDIGIRTMFHTTVADDIEANIQAFRQAADRVDVIVCTGGLGPTADDLTREAIANAFGLSLELDEKSLSQIQQMFESRGREMPERNRAQAMFPQGSQPIHNPHGTAPGVDLVVSDKSCRIFSLPGVPAEMKEMWFETVGPALVQQLGDDARMVMHYRLKCFGMGESSMEANLPDLIRRGRNPTVGITVSKATITLRITGQAETTAAFSELIQPTIETVRESLGHVVFGEEDEELQHVVSRQLLERNESVAVAEYGSGGLISEWLADLPDAQKFFRGGAVVCGANSANQVLGVDVAPDSPDFVGVLAASVRERNGADYGISLGPFPDSVTEGNPQVYIGLATPEGITTFERGFAGHPNIQKERAAKQTLDVLRLHMLASDHG